MVALPQAAFGRALVRQPCFESEDRQATAAPGAFDVFAQRREKVLERVEHRRVFELGEALLGPRLLGSQQARDAGALRLLLRREGQAGRVHQQLECFVDAPELAKDLEHTLCRLGALAPVAAGEHFADALARAEAIVANAAAKAALVAARMDAATVRMGQVRAGDAGGLVQTKLVRSVKR